MLKLVLIVLLNLGLGLGVGTVGVKFDAKVACLLWC